MLTESVALAVDAHAILGEGPIWDDRSRDLVWVDILGRRIYRYQPGTGQCAESVMPSHVSLVALRASGGFVVGLKPGFAALAESGEVEMLVPFLADPSLRLNDGRVDSRGRLWAGTMSYAQKPQAGALYRLDAGFGLAPVVERVTISNGLGWSPRDDLMYYIDTPTRRVDVFDFDPPSGSLENRRPFVEIEEPGFFPDGMTVDTDGYVWVCLWGGGAVHRYDPDGALDRRVLLPVTQVTSCAFGGVGLEDLYITSAATDLDAGELARQPLAGGLFVGRPGGRGRLEHRFAG